MADVSLACACGSFQAVIRDASARTGNHAICYCVDCQAFARHLGQGARILDASGGTQIYQAQPYQVSIETGAENLAVLQLAKKGLYRWYASCCNTPLCNTMGSAKFSFVGFMVPNMKPPLDALGPVRFRYKRDQATAPVSEPSGSLLRFAMRTARNAMRSRLNGKWRETPFFDASTGQSAAKPYRLSEAEREKAYKTANNS